MKLGALLMPSHPPERTATDGQRWDLEELERLDALGFEEAWIGEHFTAVWEPCPAPDLRVGEPKQRKQAAWNREPRDAGLFSARGSQRNRSCEG